MTVGESPEDTRGQSGIVRAALLGLCPRCAEATLFEAPARVALTCEACGLDLGALERGGRFGGVLTALVAILLMLAAVGVDMALDPPLWLQAAFWAPVTVVAVIGALRLFKTVLLCASYEHRKGPTE